MKVTYTTPTGRLTFEMELASGKQAFEVVAAIQELFEEADCGCCQSKNIRCDVREYDQNKYYKLCCNDCAAQLDFGQKKDGKTLFVKRRDKEGQDLPNRGWYIYQGHSSHAPTRPTNHRPTSAPSTPQYDSPDEYGHF